MGTYPITVGAGTLAAANYDFTNLVNGALTIAKAHLTVTANAATSAYGASPPTPTAKLSGFVNGDTSSVVSGAASLNTTATAASGVGTLPRSPSGAVDPRGGELRLHQPGQWFPSLHRQGSCLTVTANAATSTYGVSPPTPTATLSGFVNGDTSSVVSGIPSLSTPATAASGAGTYPITVGAGTLSAANYDFPNLINGSLTIAKAHLTETANAATSTYGASLPALTATLSGFVNNDTAGVVSGVASLSTAATAASGLGAYSITVGVGTLAAANYDFTDLVNGTLTIAKAALTVTADAATPSTC